MQCVDFSQSVQSAHFVVLIHIMYMSIGALTSDYGAFLAASSPPCKGQDVLAVPSWHSALVGGAFHLACGMQHAADSSPFGAFCGCPTLPSHARQSCIRAYLDADE